MSGNLLGQYFRWHFGTQLRAILKGWKNLLKFNLRYFSLGFLCKTFFSPWRRYRWSYGRGLSIKRYLNTFISNSISRVLGAIARFVLIVVGLIAEFLMIMGGILVIIIWLVLPLILVGGLIFGFKVMF